MLIAFIGIDGSGKTTQSLLLKAALERLGIKSEYIHFTPLIISFIYAWTRKFQWSGSGCETDSPLVSSMSEYDANRHFVSVLRRFPALLTLFGGLLSYFFTCKSVRFFKRNPKVLIVDRYFYDALASLISKNICSRVLTWLYLTLPPKPDMTFLLDLEGDKAYKRKKERFPSYYSDIRLAYLQLMPLLPGPAILVDTSKNCEKVHNFLLKEVKKFLRLKR